MKYDKSKVYTSLNADELKVGSKVIAADDLEHLKFYVEHGSQIETLTGICGEDATYRFTTTKNDWNLAYLVEEPGKLIWTGLKVGDVIRHGLITALVTEIDPDEKTCYHICAGRLYIDDDALTEWEKVE